MNNNLNPFLKSPLEIENDIQIHLRAVNCDSINYRLKEDLAQNKEFEINLTKENNSKCTQSISEYKSEVFNNERK